MTTTPPPAAPEPTPAYQPTAYAPAAPAQKWNTLAIVTLVLGILNFGLIPIILGIVSLNQIKKTGEQGKILAIIGIILGALAVLFWLIIIIVAIAAAANGTVTTY